jgi:hypothetical protein
MLPQTNGTIIRIGSDGPSDDWSTSAGVGNPKWSGACDTYVKQKITKTFSQNEGAMVQFRDVTLYVDQSLRDRNGNRIEFDVGDIITYIDPYGNEHSRRIMDDTNPRLPQVPAAMTYRQLHLEIEKLET